MKIEQPPKISTVEKSNQLGSDHIVRNLRAIGNKKEKGNDALHTAQEKLIGNANLYNKFLQSLVGKLDKQGGDASNLAGLENMFVSHCQNLSNEEIDSLVRQFNTGFKEFIRKNKNNIKEEQFERIHNEGIKSIGIKSVVEFIKERKKLLDLEPTHEYAFRFEDVLDARHKIDLMEFLYHRNSKGEVLIDTLNLIQVKSSAPTEREKDEIINAHREWITSSVMDLDRFNKEFKNGIPDHLTLETLVKNEEEVANILLDIFTGPNKKEFTKAEEFIAKLDLGKLENKHKAWLFLEYGERLKNIILEAKDKEKLDNEFVEDILSALQKLEDEIKLKAKMPKSLAKIGKINSIICVGAEIIKTENISKEEREGHEKIMGIAA